MRPWEVNQLTLFQLSIFMGGLTDEHGKVKLTPIQAAEVKRQKANQ